MLEISNLYKSYGNTHVLKDINLELEENKIYGLLGRNGIGKTTLLNIIGNQIGKDSGKVRLDGEEVFDNSNAISDICLVREKGSGTGDIKVSKIFNAAKVLYKDWDEEYKNYLVKEFDLDIKKKYKKLSRGNQTIVGLIIGLASKARFTIFDEPSLGLDAVYRDKFYNLLLEDFENDPRTIIISTHLIDEVTNLFEEVIILKDGKVFIKDEVNSLMEKSYYLNGKEDLVFPMVNNKNIIYKDKFGSKIIVGIYDNLDREEKFRLREKNIDISPIPLQKLFIYLTESNSTKGVL